MPNDNGRKVTNGNNGQGIQGKGTTKVTKGLLNDKTQTGGPKPNVPRKEQGK